MVAAWDLPMGMGLHTPVITNECPLEMDIFQCFCGEFSTKTTPLPWIDPQSLVGVVYLQYFARQITHPKSGS